ncbi:MAG: ATPase, partial [Yoonia sp.]
MNMHTSTVMAPPAPKTISQMLLPLSMMRDILIKTMFRMNVTQVAELSRIVCLPVQVTQELMDMARQQLLVEAMGTMSASASNEMGYQLTDSGKARAIDALAQSEYFGAMPVPLDIYREQIKRQSIRNIAMSRDKLAGAMGHLILPPDLLGNLG